eukprot:3761385-Pleurochrysis_carterae.AAC.1
MRKVHQHTPRRFKQLWCWTTHGAAEHAHGEGDVWPSLGRAIEECPYERLVRGQHVGTYCARWFACESIFYHLGQRLRRGSARLVERKWHPVRQ